jgi:hypothetical protein
MMNKAAKPLTDQESAWEAALTRIGFMGVDDFDEVLLKGITNGYFDQEELNTHLKRLGKINDRSRKQSKMREAWSLFHDSFENNVDVLTSTLRAACLNGIDAITVNNLDAAVSLLRRLGKPEWANELIALHSHISPCR